jgi:hypothetical protein
MEEDTRPQPRLRPPRSSRPCDERKAFIVRSPLGVLQPAGALRDAVTSLLVDRLPELRDSGSGLHISDACRMGDQSRISRVYLTVATLEEADLLVRCRCHLRGTGISIMDVLSPVERRLHQQLWPLFLEARSAGSRAQFQRARLMVDGRQVFPRRAGGVGQAA